MRLSLKGWSNYGGIRRTNCKNPELLQRDLEVLLKTETAREKLAAALHKTADITAAEN